MTHLIRLALTGALIAVIWQNTHWSVALFAICSAIGFEGLGFMIWKVTKILKSASKEDKPTATAHGTKHEAG